MTNSGDCGTPDCLALCNGDGPQFPCSMDKRQLYRNIASGDRARRRMEKTGVTPNGHPLWTPPEKGTLADKYPDYEGALVEIKRRTRPAAHSKATRMRITKPAPRLWDDNELLRLRRVYPRGSIAEILAVFPGRSWGAIRSQALKHHIYRARALRQTGIPLIDALLQRASHLNMSLKEIDEAVGAGAYFSVGSHRTRRPKPERIFAAVHVLGGVPRARFPPQRP